MSMSSPSNVRLPHASAGPFWAPSPVAHRHEWHEIETLLAAPATAARSAPRSRRSIPSFAFVAAALMLGGGLLGMTLISSRSDCGAACHVVTAKAGPSGEAPRPIDTATAAPSGEAPHHLDTAALAPAPDTAMREGRSAAEPVLDMTTPAAGAPDSAASDPVIPEPVAPPLPHRHHHHHHWAHP